MTKKPEPERTEASPPANPAAGAPPAPAVRDPLRSINEPAAPTAATGDLQSVNEPARPPDAGHERSPQAIDVSRETKPEPESGGKKHR